MDDKVCVAVALKVNIKCERNGWKGGIDRSEFTLTTINLGIGPIHVPNDIVRRSR